ncbi:MAG: CBS domain-containing protein [Thiohalocapsa sp.]
MPAREIQVEQVMNPDVLTVTPGTTTMDALRQMAAKHVGAIVVTKKKKLTGIFTERDLLYKVVLAGKNPAQTPVSEVMTRNVVSIAPDRSVEWAMNKMAHGNFRHLVVSDNGEDIHGMISIKDLARALRLQVIDGRRPAA